MAAHAVAIRNVHKSFRAGEPVLKDISVDVGVGEMVGLIGASGSGKSTLIRIIAGFEGIDKGPGEVALYGTLCQTGGGRRHREIGGLRQDIGVIFQQFNLIGRLSLLTNVLAGRLGRVGRMRGTLGLFPRADKIKALQALERVGIVEQAYQRASTLSGGQQQRAAIARALTQEAKLILADEPIASLDPRSAENVMSTLREINREDGVTVLVSLHQIDHAFKHCDRIVALKDGKVVHDGRVEDITKEDLQELYGVEAIAGSGAEARVEKNRHGPPSGPGTASGQGHRQRPELAAASAMDV